MNASNSNLLGQIAFEVGYVSAEQLEECLKLQSGAVAFAPIGLLLLEKGYLTLEQLEDLLRIQRLRFQALSADPSQGGLFGQIAIRRGWVSAAQLAECLREQEASAKAGSSLRLGQIFLDKKFLTVPQFLEIIRLQNKEVAQCPHCQTFFDTHEATPGTPFGCSSCGHVVRSRA
ncbi:MAG TPA: hypothetical protein VNM14_22390 [Planctomycetota bacterium]|jgi:hypothetical protein|nr:hypothetical protein [Planctomycetota bacterium]